MKSVIEGSFRTGIPAKFNLQWKTPGPEASQDSCESTYDNCGHIGGACPIQYIRIQSIWHVSVDE